jgi:hypothetical protein
MRTRVAKVGATTGTTAVTVIGIVLLGLVTQSAGQTAGTDKTGGYIVFPKIVVDTGGVLLDAPTDTFVQISNTDLTLTETRAVNCVWVNATSLCGAPGQTCPVGPAQPCITSADCEPGLQCIPCWSETDFAIELTPGQPIGFHASAGEQLPCFGFQDPDPGCLQANQGAVLPAPGDPFIGELKCVQETVFNTAGAPLAARNDLKGEATIISANGTVLRTAAYNAWAFPTAETADATDASAPICLGGFDAGGNPAPLANPCGAAACGLRYAGCPGVLILDHFFEGAPNVLGDGPGTFVRTSLTLVPCSEAISTGSTFTDQRLTTAQFLIYNEFEQRYSASARIQCYRDTPLADIDSRPGPSDDAFSIFSVAVQGTLTGQTRIRGVAGQEEDFGHGLIGVAQEFYFDSGFSTTPVESAAYELHAEGERQQGDAVCRPLVLGGP